MEFYSLSNYHTNLRVDSSLFPFVSYSPWTLSTVHTFAITGQSHQI